MQHMSANHEISVILVHGIGDLVPREVMRSAAAGIQRALPGVDFFTNERSPVWHEEPTTSDAHVATSRLEWPDARIELTEFHWAAIPGKIRARHPLRALRQILGVLKEFTSMSVNTSTSPILLRLSRFYASLQQGLVLITLALSIVLVADGFRKAPDEQFLDAIDVISAISDRAISGTEKPADAVHREQAFHVLWSNYPLLIALISLVLISALMCMILLTGCFIFPVVRFVGLRRWHQLGTLWRTAAASTLLMALAIWPLAFAAQGTVMGMNIIAGAGSGKTILPEDFPLAAAILILVFLAFSKTALIFANLLRDITHYLATDANGQSLGAQKTIQEKLWNLIQQQAQGAAPRKIVLVAHSLGTVIVVDMLRRRADTPQPCPPFELAMVTAGSPLRRLIYRFLPERAPAPITIYRELTQARAFKLLRWINVYRILDYVGQRLTSRQVPPGAIREVVLRPRHLPPFGHGNYWGDARFLHLIAAEVVKPMLEDTHSP
jgi:hypothetical protein